VSSAISDLIAAARDQGCGGTPATEERWHELADAAEAELGALEAGRRFPQHETECCGGNDQLTSHTMDCSKWPGAPVTKGGGK
jgi:hypothetical protein